MAEDHTYASTLYSMYYVQQENDLLALSFCGEEGWICTIWDGQTNKFPGMI